MTKFENILKNARKLIKTGWCQNTLSDCGCYCISGAIIYSDHLKESNDEYPYSAYVLVYLLNLLKRDGQDFEYLDQWNDVPGRTKEDVLNLLDKAIDLLR